MTPVYNFTWNGTDANAAHGICTMEICSTVIAERRDNTEVVAGRSGLVHKQDGAVEEVERKLTIYLPYEQNHTVSDFDAIRKWLKGYGMLTLSTLPNRYMMAYITDQIALDPLVQGFNDLQGSVIFRCEPYLYHQNITDIVLTEATTELSNPGGADAEPIITINATGDIDLMINGHTILLTDLTGSIVINSVCEEAYIVGAGGVLTNANALMSGDFPHLKPGNNAISWSLGEDAVLTNIVIRPNWRDEN